jgi:hypothetical protein
MARPIRAWFIESALQIGERGAQEARIVLEMTDSRIARVAE